jgi:hypothetical protein
MLQDCLFSRLVPVYAAFVDRVANKARSFKAAAEWDIQQRIRLSPRGRQAIASKLRQRVDGRKAKDLRERRCFSKHPQGRFYGIK